MKTTAIFVCAQCKKEFSREPYRIHSVNVFCGMSCKNRYAQLNQSPKTRRLRALITRERIRDGFGFKKGHTGFLTKKHYDALSEKMRGEKCYAWRGGITKPNIQIRNSRAFRQWREAVFKRDDYTCLMPFCGKRGGKINANHILPFRNHHDRRLDVGNGITLCVECHRHIHLREEVYANLFFKIVAHGV